MQTLHVRTNEQAMTKILTYIDSLSRDGNDIEVLDNKVFAFEKMHIDRALADVREGRTHTIEEVERELLGAG